MNVETFKNTLSDSIESVKLKSNIQDITQFYKLKLISDMTNLSYIYTKNNNDHDHPAVKSAFAQLKNSSFKYLASCTNINGDKQKLDDLSKDIVEGPLYNKDEVQNTINSLEPIHLQDLIDSLMTVLIVKDTQIENQQDESAQIFNFFSSYIIIEQYIWN